MRLLFYGRVTRIGDINMICRMFLMTVELNILYIYVQQFLNCIKSLVFLL